MSIQTADVQNKSTARTAIVTSPWPLILYNCPSEIIIIKKERLFKPTKRFFYFFERAWCGFVALSTDTQIHTGRHLLLGNMDADIAVSQILCCVCQRLSDLTCPDILLTAGRFSWVTVSDQEPLNYKQLKIAFALITVIPKVKHSHINIYEDKHTQKNSRWRNYPETPAKCSTWSCTIDNDCKIWGF